MQQSSSAATTQFALLGLIAAQPATAYALTKRMEISYAYFWPRARSHVYAEVKRLAALGYVRGAAAGTGRRKSVTFTITARGRAALRVYLSSPSGVFALEMEPLVRLYLARFGDDASLLRALSHAGEQAERMLGIAREIVPAYLNGQPPPPADRLRDRTLLIAFLARFALLVRQWSAHSQREVTAWAELDEQAVDARALHSLRQLARELARCEQLDRAAG